MKKITTMLLTIGIAFSFLVPIKAEQEVNFYAYSSSIGGFNEYTSENLSDHIYAYYGYPDTSLELGNGIKVFGDVDFPLVVYPIWKNNEIVATFKVIYRDGNYSGSYSAGNVEQLNYFRNLATSNNPIKLFKLEGEFLCLIGNTIFDMTDGIGNVVEEIDITRVSFDNGIIINSASTLPYTQSIISRAPSSYSLGWSFNQHSPREDWYCYAFCLSAILKAIGYSSYSVETVKTGIMEVAGQSVPLVACQFYHITTYLDNEGFQRVYNSSGNLPSSLVTSYIGDHKYHIMIGLSFANTDMDHYGVIYGYYTSNGSYIYRVYDPQENNDLGRLTMEASANSFTNSDGSTFIWDSGYITMIRAK